jgi:hypothetical protein
VAGFDRVAFHAAGELEIEQTGRERLRIDAEPAVLAKVRTEVRDGTLTIDFAPGRVVSEAPVRFRLEVRRLVALDAGGAGTLRIGPLATDALDLRLAGSNRLHLARLDARTLATTLDGAGEVAVEGGRVQRQRVQIGGASTYVAPGLASGEAEVRILGSGTVELAAQQRLAVQILGSGTVRYHGRPQVERAITGAGIVLAAD